MSTIAGSTSAFRALARRWPAAAGAGVALLTTLSLALLDEPTDAAAVVTASGFVYLGAAALGIRWAAWPIFGISFVVITIGFLLPAFDPSVVLLGLAVVLLGYGLVRRRTRPAHALPLQLAAMVILGATALIAARLDPLIAGVVIATALLIHAGWDLYHHRRDRVVARSMAEFCLVLDTVLAVAVLVLTFS